MSFLDFQTIHEWSICEMKHFIFELGDFNGSEYLELRKGYVCSERKFTRSDSLYILDDAFYFFLEAVFFAVVSSFDMFEDTFISKSQWKRIMNLNLKDVVDFEDYDLVAKTLDEINNWVKSIPDSESGFTVIGV